MSGMHSWLRRESRADIAAIWQAYQAGQRLVKEDLRLARRMAAHPEWTSWWERADQITEAEVLTPDGVDPYLAIIAEAMVESATGKGGPKVARQTFRQLCRQGMKPEEARIEVGRILLGVFSLTASGQMPIEQSEHTIEVYLHRLAMGEQASQIFGVE